MIVAIDFDGILCKNEFPNIGSPNYDMILLARKLMDSGHEVVLWTSRTDNELLAAVEWCNDRGLHFSSINENAPSNMQKYRDKYPNGTRKVYADVYIDDHNPDFIAACKNMDYEYALKYTIKMVRRIVKL